MEEGMAEGGSHLFGMTFMNLIWDMMLIFLFVIWFWILIRVIGDLFRRKDISSLGKAAWLILLVVLPYIGIFAYLLTQGWNMEERDVQQAEVARAELRKMIGFSVADEIKKLEDLKSSGSITEDEYTKLRGKLI